MDKAIAAAMAALIGLVALLIVSTIGQAAIGVIRALVATLIACIGG